MKSGREKAQKAGGKAGSGVAVEIPDEQEIVEILSPYVREMPAYLPGMVRSHLGLLTAWNRKVGLTALTDPRDILRMLFGESFFGIAAAGIAGGLAVDVGSGAGFPGVPAAMVVAELRVVLVESSTKKAAFLREVLRSLGFGDRLEVFQGRFEQWNPGQERADWILSRAVAVDRKFLSQARSVLRPTGRVVLWTTRDLAERIASEFASGWQWKDAVPIPGSKSRCVFVGIPAEA